VVRHLLQQREQLGRGHHERLLLEVGLHTNGEFSVGRLTREQRFTFDEQRGLHWDTEGVTEKGLRSANIRGLAENDQQGLV
jgi:hypothetical protein